MRICDHPECIEPAQYKAPKSRMSRDSYWFCLDHVRHYNREWNYYEGMTSEEIEADRYCDLTWRRQTAPLGGMGVSGGVAGAGNPSHNAKAKAQPVNFLYDDPFDILYDANPNIEVHSTSTPHNKDPNIVRFAPNSPEEKALRDLNLQSPITIEAIKNTYKEIARRLHPDLTSHNLTDKEMMHNEKQLKKINSAYHIIKAYLKSQS